MRRWHAVTALLLLGVAAALGTWFGFRPVAVRVTRPMRGAAVDAVYATGTVEPTIEVPIAPRIMGRIAKLYADEGDLVKKGALLVELVSADLQADVEQLRARFQYARSNYERNAKLRREGLVSPDTLEHARTDMLAAAAALKNAREQLRYTQLRAPIGGRIIWRDGEVGELISANQPIFHLAGTEPLRISAEVDEEDIARVRPGQRVLIRADAFPGSVFHGRVAAITPRGNPTTRSYRVRVALKDHPPLQIGMTAEINIIITERQNALLVPSSAVSGGELWLLRGGRAEHVKVKVGVVGAQRTEIRSGLQSHQWVVVHPTGLKSGERVHAEPASPSALAASASH